MEKKKKETAKLSKYLIHWADHNDSHKESYIKWRDVAKNNGLNSIAEKIDNAIKMMDKSTEYLTSAYGELQLK